MPIGRATSALYVLTLTGGWRACYDGAHPREDRVNVKKLVSVEQLKFGVYVNESIGRRRTRRSFYQGFVISSEAQLQTLKKFCRKVVIDTDKGDDVAPLPVFGRGVRGPSVLDTIKSPRHLRRKGAGHGGRLPAAARREARDAGVERRVRIGAGGQSCSMRRACAMP